VSAPFPAFPHLPAESWELYLGDRLDGDACERVERHVDDCATCRAILYEADPSRAFRLLRAPAPDGTWDGFWDELRPQLTPAAARPRRALRLIAGLAAALLVGSVATIALHSQRPVRVAEPDPCENGRVVGDGVKLTTAECHALFGRPLEGQPELVVIHDLDLKGL
jgi:hypothetical protein